MVPVGAMPETFGGEYNCLFGDSLWEGPHCCTAYSQAESLDKKAQEEDMHLFAPIVALVQQVSYYLTCYLTCWFCNLIFSVGLYFSLRQFSSLYG